MSSRVSRCASRIATRALALSMVLGVASGAHSLQAQSPNDTADGVVAELYDIVTFDAGTTPDWDRARALFVDEAVVVLRTSREGSTTFSVEGWIADFVSFIENRNVVETGFIEKVVRTHSVVFGDIANIWVLYQPELPGSDRPAMQGVDNFSLVKKDGRWLIASITNEVVTPDRPVPEVLRGELHERH